MLITALAKVQSKGISVEKIETVLFFLAKEGT